MTSNCMGLAGTITVLASLLTIRGTPARELNPKEGFVVLLTHPCKGIWDGRPVIVRYWLDHSSSIGRVYYPVEDDLRREIAATMASRWEHVVYLEASDRLTYGEVTSLIDDLQEDDPTLHVALIMKSQDDAAGTMHPTYFQDFC